MAQTEITGATTIGEALLEAIPHDLAELYVTRAEVVAARDGEVSLIAKIDAIDTAVAALGEANGPLAEYIADRFVIGDSLNPQTTATTLSLEWDESYAFFLSIAF
jgi:hypothetical protein